MKLTSRWPGATRHLVGLVVGWFGFSILLGLFYEFDRMEASSALIPSLNARILLLETTLTFLTGITILTAPIFGWWLLNRNNDQKKSEP